jgi:hypothetical protein
LSARTWPRNVEYGMLTSGCERGQKSIRSHIKSAAKIDHQGHGLRGTCGCCSGVPSLGLFGCAAIGLYSFAVSSPEFSSS